MAHTPGPWRFEEGTKTIRAVPSNHWLASMNSWDGAVDHAANARLIAAAPDMLAALKSARDFIQEEAENRSEAGSEYSDYEREPRELVDLIDSAIAKAEGRA